MKRLIIALLFTSLFIGGYAQEVKNAKWEYGIHTQFINGMIKPVAADTFTNKAGFGGSLFLERKFETWRLRCSPGFVQSRYFNDFENRTYITNALDLSIQMSHPIDQSGQTFFHYGPIVGYTLQHQEKNLDGTNVKTGIHNKLVTKSPFDAGIKLGLGLDLNPGVRLTANYIDFFNGRQRSGKITGRIDYLQVGVQIRMKELLASDHINDKLEAIQKEVDYANQSVRALHKDGGGVLVFVVNTDRTPLLTHNTARDSIDRIVFEENQQALIKAIRQRYTFGEYKITFDSIIEQRNGTGPITVITEEGMSTFTPLESQKVFYARIDELFLENNGNLKWGIFVFNDEMELMKEPFPYFTPYQNLDKDFESAEKMVAEFNASLKLSYTTEP